MKSVLLRLASIGFLHLHFLVMTSCCVSGMITEAGLHSTLRYLDHSQHVVLVTLEVPFFLQSPVFLRGHVALSLSAKVSVSISAVASVSLTRFRAHVLVIT